MRKFTKLSEAAKEILDTSVASKRAERDSGDAHKKGAVGEDKLDAAVAYGEKDAGVVGKSPEKKDDDLPDYLKGTPQATPPGATPPVGKQSDGVGAKKPAGQPQETQGRADLVNTAQAPANDHAAMVDRKASKLAPQTFEKNAGATFDCYEDVEALLQGENLSEEFKQKATTIFEAAVAARVSKIVEETEATMAEQFEAAVEKVKDELAEKVNDYLEYMVESWMKDNELAIEKGLRAEIVEEFIAKLRNLFVESYIDIPEDKVDVIGELAEKVEELEASLNEEIRKNVEAAKVISEQRKVQAIAAACEGLTQTQVEKLKSLAESVEFTDESEFADKMNTLKKSYFPSDVKVADKAALTEEIVIEEEKPAKKSADEMDIYTQAISKSVKA